jgi:hypothetical protein
MHSRMLRILIGIEAVVVGALLLILTPKKLLARDNPCCNTTCLSNDWDDGCLVSNGNYCTHTKLEKHSCLTYICNGSQDCAET